MRAVGSVVFPTQTLRKGSDVQVRPLFIPSHNFRPTMQHRGGEGEPHIPSIAVDTDTVVPRFPGRPRCPRRRNRDPLARHGWGWERKKKKKKKRKKKKKKREIFDFLPIKLMWVRMPQILGALFFQTNQCPTINSTIHIRTSPVQLNSTAYVFPGKRKGETKFKQSSFFKNHNLSFSWLKTQPRGTPSALSSLMRPLSAP
jgi:hypothetical protein